MNNFNLKKFLVENKLTTNSKLLKEEAQEMTPQQASAAVTAQADQIAQDPTVKKIAAF